VEKERAAKTEAQEAAHLFSSTTARTYGSDEEDEEIDEEDDEDDDDDDDDDDGGEGGEGDAASSGSMDLKALRMLEKKATKQLAGAYIRPLISST
jgi:hypothetical protein